MKHGDRALLSHASDFTRTVTGAIEVGGDNDSCAAALGRRVPTRGSIKLNNDISGICAVMITLDGSFVIDPRWPIPTTCGSLFHAGPMQSS